MEELPRLVKLRIGKRTYPVKTTLDSSQVRKLESLLDALVFEDTPGVSQEEELVLLALRLAHALERARNGLERLSNRDEGESG